MSTYYLLDLFNDQINDVVVSKSAPPTVLTTGNYVVRLDDDLFIQEPTDLADLLTNKYAGILGAHGLFTQITYDPMLDPTSIDFSNSTGICSGYKGSTGIYAKKTGLPTPVLRTNTHSITWTGLGAGPSEVLVTYEVYTYADSDSADAPLQRYYTDLIPDVDLTAQISFDGGSTFTTFQDKALLTVPIVSRGTDMILRFERKTDVSSVQRVFLGSWAVLY